VENRIFLGEHIEYLVRHAELGQFQILASRQAEAQEGVFDPGQTGLARWRGGVATILFNN
jgi:spermidine/putrescine transport system ATP-binding protein